MAEEECDEDRGEELRVWSAARVGTGGTRALCSFFVLRKLERCVGVGVWLRVEKTWPYGPARHGTGMARPCKGLARHGLCWPFYKRVKNFVCVGLKAWPW